MEKFAQTFHQEIRTTSNYCAITSFGIGTLIFLLYVISETGELILLGLYYTFFAFGINALLFLFNTICAFFTEEYRKQYLTNLGLLLVNIPIAFLYFYIVLQKSGF